MEIGMSLPNDVTCSGFACIHGAVLVCGSLYVICLIIPERISVALIYLSNFCCHSYAFAVNGLMAMLQAWEPKGKNILGWSGTDPCGSNWIGIHCDNSSPQRVTQM